MSAPLVRVENVSKKFCRSLKRSLWYGVQDLGAEILGSDRRCRDNLRTDEFWALKNICFEIRRGECLGLIGRNGAGKTTALRLLNGLLKPDLGRIEMHGRINALIALGAGFNPVLSGRENIYVSGAIQGLSRQAIDRKLDDIIDFAELRDFIDAPVQTYSSGMSVRLGFAAAAKLMEPDILFLDEVLAVGDIGFTIKCLNLVRELTSRSAVVFVSHNMHYVSSFCNRVILMDQGQILIDTPDTAEGIDRYLSLADQQRDVNSTDSGMIHALELRPEHEMGGMDTPCIAQGTAASVWLDFEVRGVNPGVHVTLQIDDSSLSPVAAIPLQNRMGDMHLFANGRHRLSLPLGAVDFNAGKYSFVAVVQEAGTSMVLARVQNLGAFRVLSDKIHWGKIVRPAIVES